jgi:hypothetical protein
MLLKKSRLIVMTALAALSIATVASADSMANRPLIHVGMNVIQCSGTALNIGSTNGVVSSRYQRGQNHLVVNVAVHDALPNTTYVIDVRCMGAIGALTTDSTGVGSAQLDLNLDAVPTQYYIDISVPNVGGGFGNYGDTFVAGPFN